MSQLPIHFFTIVLNGKPFIDYHIKAFKQLNIPWHWHIIEGVAELSHDTAWSVALGGKIPEKLHNKGTSNDGTTETLDLLKLHYPNNISIYRKPRGVFWDGKQEMISAPLSNINQPALLWQIDSDELWTPDQIHTMHQMFIENPKKTSAWFWCWYFVGPEKVICTRNCYAQNPNQEWNRVWRFEPGMIWATHEPPVLGFKANDGNYYDVGRINPFTHAETEANGLVFEHYSYVTESQLQFKESYYGYKGAVEAWKHLQEATAPTVMLREFLPWVSDHTEVSSTHTYELKPIAYVDKTTNSWRFNCDSLNEQNSVAFGNISYKKNTDSEFNSQVSVSHSNISEFMPINAGETKQMNQTNISPIDPNVTLESAMQSLKEGDAFKALSYLEKLSSVPEPIPNFKYVTALCLMQAGKYPEGCQALQDEISRFPQNEQALKLLEQCRISGLIPIVTAVPKDNTDALLSSDKSELETIIAPEVYNDEFYYTIIEITRNEPLTHVLEIGSSSGGGSTEALVTGLSSNPVGAENTNLYCMELSKPRFKALREAYSHLSFVKCFNVSSVPVEAFPDASEIVAFYNQNETPLNKYSLERVLGWLQQDIDYVNGANVPTNGIKMIKQSLGINNFDMVLIDGSEFTGKAELKEVYGARWILLDDICVFKNFDNYNQLLNDSKYLLYRQNLKIRHGYAVFKLR
jgi:hypothetical protein